jgi:hypothetical protein
MMRGMRGNLAAPRDTEGHMAQESAEFWPNWPANSARFSGAACQKGNRLRPICVNFLSQNGPAGVANCIENPTFSGHKQREL